MLFRFKTEPSTHPSQTASHKLKLDPPTLATGCDPDQWSAFTRQWDRYKTWMAITANVLPTVLFYCCDTKLIFTQISCLTSKVMLQTWQKIYLMLSKDWLSKKKALLFNALNWTGWPSLQVQMSEHSWPA